MQDTSGWGKISSALNRLGIAGITAAVLEHGGPLNLLMAQILYISKPFVNLAVPTIEFNLFASIMEDEQSSRDFARYLRQES